MYIKKSTYETLTRENRVLKATVVADNSVLLSTRDDLRNALAILINVLGGTDRMEKSVLEEAIKTYGADAQTDVAIEEMSELIKALLKERRGDDAIQHKKDIAEEIADVLIMVNQLMIIHDCRKQVGDTIVAKIDRLHKRLEGEAKKE